MVYEPVLITWTNEMITQMDDKFLKCEDSCFAKTGNSDCAKTDCAAKTGCKSLDSKGVCKDFYGDDEPGYKTVYYNSDGEICKTRDSC